MNETVRYKPTVTINTLINKVKKTTTTTTTKQKKSYVPQLLCRY